MTRNFIKVVLLLLFVLIQSNAWAVPKKYSNCVDTRIIEPQGSQGYFWDESCQKVYVKPPVEGEIKYDSFVVAVSDQECKAEQSLMDLIEQQIRRNEIAARDLEKAQKESEKKHQDVAKIRKKCDGQKRKTLLIESRRDQLKAQVDAHEEQVESLKKELLECQQQSENDCSDFEEKIERARSEIEDRKPDLSELSLKLKLSEIDLRACERIVESEVDRIINQDEGYQEALKALFKERQELLNVFRKNSKELMKVSGGKMVVSLFSKHNQLVQEYKNLNQNLKIEFAPIPLAKANIFFERVTNGIDSAFPLIMRSNIYGLQSSEEETGVDLASLADGSNENAKSFGEGAGGEIIVNKYTVCTALKKHRASSDREKLEAITNLMKPTVTFTYDVQVERRIKIKYAESHLYQLIKKSTSKRGFFRSSSSTSITERSEAEKWIQIEVSSEDERLKFEDAEDLMLELRKDFLDAALMKVARSYTTQAQVDLQDPGQDGATKAGKVLKDRCVHSYCQYAAIALDIGSALFGGSTSEASMTRTVSAQESQELSNKATVREFGQMTLNIERD